METTYDNLDIRIIHRPGNLDAQGRGTHERFSVDFVANGRSLYEDLSVEHLDFVGRFSPDTIKLNEESAEIFLLTGMPDLENGRVMLYVCPECGDIGCGAITVKITKAVNSYLWSDFGYENNYDCDMTDFNTYKNVGPFVFEAAEYQKAIEKAKNIEK